MTRERPVQWCHEHRYNTCLWNFWTIPALLHPTKFYAVVKQTELQVQCRKVKFSFVVVSLVWLEVDKLTPLSKNSSWECEAEQWGGVAYNLKLNGIPLQLHRFNFLTRQKWKPFLRLIVFLSN
jgi:hypothetical protein